jgi:hypothetical protein
MVISLIRQPSWTLLEWYNFLNQDLELEIGRDFVWAWQDDYMAIDIFDDKIATLVRLKTT